MKKGDLTTKAIGLAIAGVLAGSGLAMALPQGNTTGDGEEGDRREGRQGQEAGPVRQARL